MICELWGGPQDGLMVDTPQSTQYKIPVPISPRLIQTDPESAELLQLQCHIYQFMGNKRKYPFRIVPILEYQGVK